MLYVMIRVALSLILAFALFGCTHTSYMEKFAQPGTGDANTEGSTVSSYKTTGKAVVRAAGDVLPGINNINTCPPGMKRVDHIAGGSADSNITVNELGAKFEHTAEGGQSHNCVADPEQK